MSTRKSLAAVLAMGTLIALLADCGNNPVAGGGPTQLRFHNAMQQQPFPGNTVTYQIKNVVALGDTWNEVIDYGSYSSYKTVDARSTDFTIHGEMNQSGTWTPVQWTKAAAMSPNSENTVNLTFE